ncbi:hypothetical protein [Dryocola sp. BD613]|uniref:hypothetical protein n=1 Tax=Dryocola sp. BD613 TaxID=3133272 RepID=UPI003F507DBF
MNLAEALHRNNAKAGMRQKIKLIPSFRSPLTSVAVSFLQVLCGLFAVSTPLLSAGSKKTTAGAMVAL